MSTPTYQKIAVIFGCNYYGQQALQGAINDANEIKKFLLQNRGFQESNVLTVYDKKMTRNNMFKTLEELAAQTHVIAERSVTPAVFLYYSGHGTQVPDTKNIEEDGKSEALVPYDFEKVPLVLDHELFDRFIKKLHPTTELFLFTDTCNSGTNFNLAYNGMSKAYTDNEVEAEIIGLSGSSDPQTSAEVSGRGLATVRFIEVMEDSAKIAALKDFRRAMADVSIPGHVQTPQVSVSKQSLLNDRLFTWLLQDTGEAQLSQRKLRQLTKRQRRSRFFEQLGQSIRQLTGK